VRALIFDMDGTLYRNARLDQAYENSMYPLIAERKGLTEAGARRLFAERYAEMRRRLGRQPSKLYTLAHMGISDLVWAARQGRIPVTAYLRPNRRLRAVLLRLRASFRMGIVTNNHHANTLATLNALGIQDCFDSVLTLTESRRFKPSPELYTTMAERLGVDPEECLSIGDRPDLDLVPAAQVGMHTFWARSLNDIYTLPRRVRPRTIQRVELRTAASARQAWGAAAAALREGRLVVVPTDTVYGLAARPTLDAVRWLYRAKGRSADKPLVLLVADLRTAARYARLTPAARSWLAERWPGALTAVLPAKPGTRSGAVTHGGRTVALRVPAHAGLRRLLARVGGALATTSANPSGAPAPRTAAAVDERIRAFASVLVDGGACPVGKPSTVVKFVNKQWIVLRP
jgi:tRNA threonylcarbamoyl adenosine modification protein (Sua5/YciO/YrdC/YwlC family)